MTVGYRGERVVLRPVTPADRRAVQGWLLDPDRYVLTETDAWPPDTLEEAERRWAKEEPSPRVVKLAIDVAGSFVGTSVVYDLDLHNRNAMLGLALAPDHTGQGIGRDALRTLTRYAFEHRGLHRVGLQTLATNEAMIRCSRSVGFTEEGRLRDHAWINGQWVDEVLMSRVVTDPEEPA